MATHILCLETSGKQCSVAMSADGICIQERTAKGEWSHSEQISLLISELIKDSNLSFAELNAVALSKGPGSYTGLRVGASAAKALCYANDIPLIAINTLEILAFPYKNKLNKGQSIIPLIDARRSEVYYNIYDNDISPLKETTNLILEKNSFDGFPAPLFCGDATQKASDIIFSPGARFEFSHAEAKHMSSMAYARYNDQKFEDIAYFNPFYLKPPNITTSKKTIL